MCQKMKMARRVQIGILIAILIVLLILVISAISTLSNSMRDVRSKLIRNFWELDLRRQKIEDVGNRFHIVTFIELFNGRTLQGYEDVSYEQLNERDEEIIGALESNLNHPLVERVHLLYHNNETLQKIWRNKKLNTLKIQPVNNLRPVHMKDYFEYASKNLLHKAVIVLTSDIVVGEGFDLINMTKVQDEKVLYSLTKNGNLNGSCELPNYCLDRNYSVPSSHDTYVFQLAGPLSPDVLTRLDYPQDLWLGPNGVLGVFEYIYNFQVYNPCKVLKTYYRHCSKTRPLIIRHSILEPPYNWPYSNIGQASPVDKLLYGTSEYQFSVSYK